MNNFHKVLIDRRFDITIKHSRVPFDYLATVDSTGDFKFKWLVDNCKNTGEIDYRNIFQHNLHQRVRKSRVILVRMAKMGLSVVPMGFVTEHLYLESW